MVCAAVILFQAAVLGNAIEPWIVKEGDTLFAIARKRQVPLDVLRQFNGLLETTRLKVGQLVRFPDVHTVKKGDTLFGIARDLSVPLSGLLDLNGLTQSSRIVPGQRIFVPLSPKTAQGPPPSNTQQSSSSSSGSSGQQAGAAGQRGSTPAPTAGQAASAAMGAFVWPHPGRHEPYKGRLPGLVFYGSKGDLVQSATAGEVEWVAPYLGYGIAIIIRAPDKSLLTYKGNEAALVNVGDRVVPGTEIARLGVSPLLGGDARLYLSIKDSKGQTVDPEKYFSTKNQA